MEVPYRLDNIMVMTEPVMDGGLISKITLLPFENSSELQMVLYLQCIHV